MYRIRFHGRGGQGMKTASRILGTAFFLENFQVQDAPRYGAERRGAPIFAYVRASRDVINERGVIHYPDLIVVADDRLVPVAAAGVMRGATARTCLLINSFESPQTWQDRLNFPGALVVLPLAERPKLQAELCYEGAACAGAAACLVGVITRESLRQAIHQEFTESAAEIVQKNLEKAIKAFDMMGDYVGVVTESEATSAASYEPPDWVVLPFEDARVSAPAIHAAMTSVMVKTGLWRTLRPIIDHDRCNRCWWICSTFCPDDAIGVSPEGSPQIDYDHCKGCMICVAQCPPHAIRAIPEHLAAAENQELT